MKIIGEDEEIDLNLNFDRKKFAKKMLIFGTIAIVVIVASSIAGIHVAKSYNKHLISEYYGNEMEENRNSIENNNTRNIQGVREENNLAEESIKENIAQNQKESPEERERKKQDQEQEEKLKVPVYSGEAQKRVNDIYNSNDGEKIAYLTFDDGPSSKITPQILKILEEENVKATFFVLGNMAEKNPDILKQEYEAGHYIANHGYSHDYSKIYVSENSVLDEYNRTENIIKSIIGNENYSSHLFRFPGGSQGGKHASLKNSAKTLLEKNNVAYINWNCLTNDAVGKPTKESIVADLKKTSNGKDKIVVLMHDTNAKRLTVDTLKENIAYLRNEGYVFKNFYDIMY